MIIPILIVALIIILMIFWWRHQPPGQLSLPVVREVDLNRYAGTWYEIARLPASFQEGCTETMARYEVEDNSVRVTNTCIRNGEISGSVGKAIPNNAKIIPGTKILTPGRLKVSFFWPFYGDYNIIALDADYQYAMVGTEDRENLWILSRTKIIPENIYQTFLNQATNLSYDVSKMINEPSVTII